MASNKPLIGINAEYFSNTKNNAAYSYVPTGYYDSLMKAGATPIILPPYYEQEDIERVLDILDGVVMIGGADLDPQRDGFMLHPSIRRMEERREIFDRQLIYEVAKRRIPFFGVGAGMQLLNVSQGGALFLHIPEDLPNALPHIPHRNSSDPILRHALEVAPGSLMENVYGENEIRVNSMHHMAVDDVAPGFIRTAWSPDGVTEAIESTQEDWFAIGTQFHPESSSATAMDVRLFFEFVHEINERKGVLVATASDTNIFGLW
ncbi:MAG: gamma-glutamyl-gamma-aminobutyrate hydrolase family protein [Planctomycetaceae bacterium]|jgi:putative glutamine amidotransferase|nr:gamma-glutamyl-gamma-aminobutyrate hydrolase family protein [Planctomycetaceae bacterium]